MVLAKIKTPLGEATLTDAGWDAGENKPLARALNHLLEFPLFGYWPNVNEGRAQQAVESLGGEVLEFKAYDQEYDPDVVY